MKFWPLEAAITFIQIFKYTTIFYLGEEFFQLGMISNRVQNQAPRADPCQVEFKFAKSATIISFQILCSIGSQKIQIFRSNSEFPNQTYCFGLVDSYY